MRARTMIVAVAAMLLAAGAVQADVFSMGPGLTSLETVTVGNPGNAGELSGGGAGGGGPDRICGAVSYGYKIGKYEVAAGQYTEFLNAVAGVDAYGVYNPSMWTDLYGCKVERFAGSGTVGDPYRYRVPADWAKRPVNFVSWGDAARFANWLHNGQPTGGQDLTTTEDGAYFLNGVTNDLQLLAVSREADWKWAVTSEDEWYKAAYHKNDGATANYWDYPTGGDSKPSNDLVEPTDPGYNTTFYDGGFTIGSPYWRTEAGAHENSESPYGTFDQCGNVWEWTEQLVGASRGVRGGSYNCSDGDLRASFRAGPSREADYVGFRVSQVPEPATLVVLAASVPLLLRRKPKSR